MVTSPAMQIAHDPITGFIVTGFLAFLVALYVCGYFDNDNFWD